MTQLNQTIAMLVVLWAIGLFVTCARADALVEVGAGQAIYSDNDSSTDWSFQVRGGHKEFPVYGVLGWDQPKIKQLGQPIADTDVLSVGVGTRHEWDKISVFLEAGWALVDAEVDQGVQQEVVYTYLVGRHNVDERRPVPVDPPRFPYDAGNYQTSYSVDDGLFLRVGLGYQLWENVAVSASYRLLRVDTEQTLKNIHWETGEGYWREDNSLDLSAAEVTIWYIF